MSKRLAACGLWAAAAAAQSPVAAHEELARALKQLAVVYCAVEENFADPVVPEQAFYGGAIPGLLRALDPFSTFLDPDQFRAFEDMQQSVEKGFGSVVSIAPGRVVVLQTLAGTPSARTGLAAGDEIVEINGYRLDRLEVEPLVELLRESRQREAQLLARRPGVATLLPFALTPAELASPSVARAFFLRPGVGYIKVASFEEATVEELRKAVEKLGGVKLRGLVLDLRDNPGGLLPAAIGTAAMFLKPGQVVLSIRARSGAPEEIKVPEKSEALTFPVAALINGRSASGAEIVAGALQDHGRARIVGETSFGKGLVQRVFPLPEKSGLALTTALYFTPSGRSIQRPIAELPNAAPEKSGGGITPDVAAALEGLTPFRVALEASSSFLNFAQQYTASRRIPAGFDVTPALLDELQAWLSERKIRPSVSEWSANRAYLRNRLKTEIYNLAFGVAKGDEVEAERDAQIQAAARALGLR